jgi:hypothetical protein
MSLEQPPVKSAYRPRNAAQKERRLELKVIRGDEKYRLRYQALAAEMAASGHTIGKISDLDEMFATDPIRRYEVLKARVERWEALWSIAKRKRETRAKIVLGGAVLAELTAPQAGDGLARQISDILDRRVPRVRDRVTLRDLTSLALPLRQGGPPEETAEQALQAIGEQTADLDRGFGRPDYREGDEEEDFDRP